MVGKKALALDPRIAQLLDLNKLTHTPSDANLCNAPILSEIRDVSTAVELQCFLHVNVLSSTTLKYFEMN